MDDDTKGMDEALAMARNALDSGELPVGAVVALNGVVLSKAHTREQEESRFLVHAELDALLEFDRLRPTTNDRRRSVLFTTVEPCLMCLGAAMSAFVGRVVYSLASESDGATELVSRWKSTGTGFIGYQMPIATGGLKVAETRALFNTYLDRVPDGPMRRWAESVIRV